MSIGARRTACHQFSQVIALQRWILRHEDELSAPTLEDIRKRLAEAAEEASTQRTINDGQPETAGEEPGSTQMDTPEATVVTPVPVRRRLPARKGGSVSSPALTPTLVPESQVASSVTPAP
eukprot:2725290-Amphidinium_carterae.1